MTAKPGYWDVDACAWVGAPPMYVGPPAMPAEERAAPATADGEVPAPRSDVDSTSALAPDSPAG